MQPPTDHVTAEELRATVVHAFEHVQSFELRYTDATEQLLQLTITMRPLDSATDLPIKRTGWAAARNTVIFVTGLLAHVAEHVGDHYVVACMRAVCGAALDHESAKRGQA